MVVCAACSNCGKEVEVSEGLQSCRNCGGPFVAHIEYQPRVQTWRLERVTRKVGGIEWGVCLQGVPWDMGQLLGWIDQVADGFRPRILHWWHTWDAPGGAMLTGGYRPFAPEVLEKCVQYGGVPLITWASEGSSRDRTQDPARWVLARILDGTHDAYLRQFAADCKAWGGDLYLRWGHEMNGSWGFPWQESQFGNREHEFVLAWRHIVDIFRGTGADNARFVWCPNVRPAPCTALFSGLEEFWPGDDYVDVLGLDGYCGGNAPWQSFVQLFGPTYDEIVELGMGLNVIICEMGCAGRDEDKGQWLRYALANAQPRFPDLQGLVFYNRDCRPLGDGDWRIESGPKSMLALQSGLHNPVFLHAAEL